MRQAVTKKIKAQVSQLDAALTAEVHQAEYHAAVRALGLSYRLGRLDNQARLVQARKFLDIISRRRALS